MENTRLHRPIGVRRKPALLAHRAPHLKNTPQRNWGFRGHSRRACAAHGADMRCLQSPYSGDRRRMEPKRTPARSPLFEIPPLRPTARKPRGRKRRYAPGRADDQGEGCPAQDDKQGRPAAPMRERRFTSCPKGTRDATPGGSFGAGTVRHPRAPEPIPPRRKNQESKRLPGRLHHRKFL